MNKAMYYGSAHATIKSNASFAGVPVVVSNYIRVDSAMTSINIPVLMTDGVKEFTVIGFGLVAQTSAQVTQNATFNLVDAATTAGNTVATVAVTSAVSTTYTAGTVYPTYAVISGSKQLRLIVTSSVTAHTGFGFEVWYGLQ